MGREAATAGLVTFSSVPKCPCGKDGIMLGLVWKDEFTTKVWQLCQGHSDEYKKRFQS